MPPKPNPYYEEIVELYKEYEIIQAEIARLLGLSHGSVRQALTTAVKRGDLDAIRPAGEERKKRPSRIPLLRQKQVVFLYTKMDKYYREIAEILGISEGQAIAAHEAAGAPEKRNKVEVRKRAAQDRYSYLRKHWPDWRRLYVTEKVSLQEIATQYDVDKHTVGSALDNMGVPRRTKSENEAIKAKKRYEEGRWSPHDALAGRRRNRSAEGDAA